MGLPEAWDNFVFRVVRSLEFPLGSFSALPEMD